MPSPVKHIELLIRRATLALLAGRRGRRGGAAVPRAGSAPRLLLVRHDRIGDALISTPLVARLRAALPDAHITMLLGSHNAAVAPLLPSIDRFVVLPRSPAGFAACLRRLRRDGYDAAINLLAKDSASGALLTALSGARVRIGFEGASASLYDIVIPGGPASEHVVARTLRLAAPFETGNDGEIGDGEGHADPLRVVIPIESAARADATLGALLAEARRPIIAMNISGSGPEKYWGRDGWRNLAQYVTAQGWTPLIAAAPRDRAEQEAIAAAAGCGILPTTPDLADFAAMLDRADMVVTPDTSVVHLAAALGKPTVMLVADRAVGNMWGPWGVPSKVVDSAAGIGAISPDAVADAIAALASATPVAESTSAAS